jgi:signal peptidase I
MAFLLVLACIAWIACAPTQVGGQSTYVIISGVSMEPDFHQGDLVIVHETADYRVGDIVAYRNADIHGNVLHRIAGLNLDHFIFKGDNNSWLDSYQPTQEELIGKLWIHLPKVGKAIMWVRVPLNMAFTVGILGGVIMAGTVLEKPERKGKKKSNKKTGSTGSGSVEGALFGLGFLFLASLALGIYSFTHPIRRDAEAIPYEHQGTFSYSAAGTVGVYDSKTVQTGEPVFPALTCDLHLQFKYSLSAGQLQDLNGTHRISASIIEEQSNWQRTIPIEAETAFSGNSFLTDVTLNLCQVETMVETMEETTDFHPSSYKLLITPGVNISGTFDGGVFEDTFEPSLPFRFDKIHFYLDDNNLESDPLKPSKMGLLQDPHSVPNLLSLFGLKFKDITLRFAAVIGLGLSIIGILLLVFSISEAARRDPAEYIKMKYGGMMVSVSGKDPGISPHPLEVGSIDELAKIAERNNSMILHDQKDSTHTYHVNCDGKTYRCVVQKEETGTMVKPSTKRSSRGKEPK